MLEFEYVIVCQVRDGEPGFGGYPPPVTGTWPMLARVPAGDLIDRMRHEPKLRAAEVLYSDTTWRSCIVLAWARHRGGWAVLIRWRDGHEDWREYDPRHIRPGDGSALTPPRDLRAPPPDAVTSPAATPAIANAGQTSHPGVSRTGARRS